jgi:hypothetical protein
MQYVVLKHIKEQIGYSFSLCEDFPGIKEYNGKPYFNIILKDPISESIEYTHLERLIESSRFICGIEPNGVCRVAIICNKNTPA